MQHAIVLSLDRLSPSFLGPYGNTWLETPAFNQLADESLLAQQMLADSPDLELLFQSFWKGTHAAMPPAVCQQAPSLPDQLAYTMSKGALNQMTKSMALALAPWGVRVNAIGPGSINTDILKAVADDREAMQRILSRTPLNRLGDPDEIAGVAWFLANKDASYITGECIYADGGRLALNYTMKPEDYED